jgi:hypothetical protein
LPSDVSLLPDIHENVRIISVKRLPSQCGTTVVVRSSPYENKSAVVMEKKAPKEQKKACNDKKEVGIKQNQPCEGKRNATNGPTRKKDLAVTLSVISDS